MSTSRSKQNRRSSKTSEFFLTREQCRAVDAYAINQLGVPGVVLMENAGRNAAELIARWVGRERVAVAVVCGKGNNGGDGFVIARHLLRMGCRVWVDLTAEPEELSGDAGVNYASAARLGIPMHPLFTDQDLRRARGRWRRADVVVDALLGTGFAGEVREPLAGVIRAINTLRDADKSAPSSNASKLARSSSSARFSGPLIVAVDVPSGLDCDTGTTAGEAIRADRTVTFLAGKIGFAQASAHSYVGKVTIADIGVPLGLILKRLATRG